MRLIITGGHHTSALPVIEELKKRGMGDDIHWIGHKYSVKGDKNSTLEYMQVTELGIPFYDLKAGKVYRSINPLNIIRTAAGFIRAAVFVFIIKPDIILSFGGYIAAPVVFAGWVFGIPSVTHEQTVAVGYANKFISYFADKILISWPESFGHFPQGKTTLTGIPLRESVFSMRTDNFKINSNLPTVYITAGKTGSHKINLAIENCLVQLLDLCNVIHQCGDVSFNADFSRIRDEFGGEYERRDSGGRYFLRKFVMEDEIGEAFSKADLVVGRSGAHTTAELAALEKPCILIPIPWVSHNEQNLNSELLKNAGLASILPEEKLSGDSLLSEVENSLKNIDSYKLKDKSLKDLIKKNSAALIVDEIQKISKTR